MIAYLLGSPVMRTLTLLPLLQSHTLLAATLSVLVAACAAPTTTTTTTTQAPPAVAAAAPVQPPSVHGAVLDAARFPEIDAAIHRAIDERDLPGAVFHLERDGDTYEQAYGALSYEPGAAADRTDTVFDAASLTKVLATAPSVLILAEEGKINLDGRLSDYFPECANKGKEAITIRHLLTHTSGLPAGLPAKPAWRGDASAHALACNIEVLNAPGTLFRYSDINYVLLGQLVQHVSGIPLDEFARTRIYEPLRMHDTGYLPLRRGVARSIIAPTQKGRQPGAKTAHGDLALGEILQGVVHDPTGRRMDGVAGSAGVFTTAHDVARYARMLLNDGELDGVRILSPHSVRLMTTAQSPAGLAPRGMGMDINSPYAVRPRGTLYPVSSYGHTGFTGCVLWIDPASHSFYVFLSNRVYPDDLSRVLELYTTMGTLAAQAAGVH
jgi:CubicO group peptidase (beta-lactamase class C family)